MLTSKSHLPPPGKQGQVCMKTLRVGASVRYQCHQVLTEGTLPKLVCLGHDMRGYFSVAVGITAHLYVSRSYLHTRFQLNSQRVLALFALQFLRFSHLIIKKECRLPTAQWNTKETSKPANNPDEKRTQLLLLLCFHHGITLKKRLGEEKR